MVKMTRRNAIGAVGGVILLGACVGAGSDDEGDEDDGGDGTDVESSTGGDGNDTDSDSSNGNGQESEDSGDSNYQVQVFPTEGMFGELVFNEIGTYDGETTFRHDGIGYVHVQANGPWSLKLE